MDILHKNPIMFVFMFVGPESSIGIATHYGMEDTGIESWWRWHFPHPPTPSLGSNQPSVQGVPGLFPGVKQPRRGVNHATLSSAEVKEGAEL